MKEWLASLGGIRKLGPMRSGGSEGHAHRAGMSLVCAKAFLSYVHNTRFPKVINH